MALYHTASPRKRSRNEMHRQYPATDPFTNDHHSYTTHRRKRRKMHKHYHHHHQQHTHSIQTAQQTSGLQKLNTFCNEMCGGGGGSKRRRKSKLVRYEHAHQSIEDAIASNHALLSTLCGDDNDDDVSENDGEFAFDFCALLQRLTLQCDSDRAMKQEFTHLCRAMHKMKLNLSATQMQEIVDAEREMNGVIARIQELSVRLPLAASSSSCTDDDDEDVSAYTQRLHAILKRLSELTLVDAAAVAAAAADKEPVAVVSENTECDRQSRPYETETKCHRVCAYVENMDASNDHNCNTNANVNSNARRQQNETHTKTMIHKCAKMMLSMIVIGAPLLYYFVT